MAFLIDVINKPITGEWGTEGDKVLVLRTTNFTNSGVLDLTSVIKRDISDKKISQKKLIKGDIIIEKSGGSPNQPVGRVVFFEEDGVYLCNNFTSVLRPKKEIVVPKYLHYILYASHKFGVTELFQNKTTGIINLQLARYIKEIKIPLPPLAIQKRIAEILDNAAGLRDKTKQLLQEYDELARSIFLEMFGDPGMSSEKEKFIALDELIFQKADNGFFTKNDHYGTHGVPIVWLNNFIDKLYVEQENLRRAIITSKDEKYALKYGDALFCRSSLTPEGIGKCAIVPKHLNEKTLFECHIIRLRLDLAKIVPEYFRFLTETQYFRFNVEKRSKTSTMTTISQNGITDIEIPVPSLKLQNQFAEKIILIQQQKELVKQELKESEDLFLALLQKAFKGELVKEENYETA